MIRTRQHLLIFTDVDGTLLDHDTYDFTPALSTLDLLRKRSIPVILCTSKTRAETEAVRLQMELDAPFIVENGSAIFVPKETLHCTEGSFIDKGKYLVREFGTAHKTLREVWKQIQSKLDLPMQGFSEMGLEEIMALTGLSREMARLAALREYTEPFIYDDSDVIPTPLRKEVEKKGLQITKGGRFFHLMGDNDKGKAVRVLTRLYRATYPDKTFKTVGLGDSKNDFPMLASVDIPVVIRKKEGMWESVEDIPSVIYSQRPGPAGWAEEIERLLI